MVCHSAAFAEAAGGPAGDRAILLAAKALAMTAVDLFTKPAALRGVREEFDKGRSKVAEVMGGDKV
jgi:hypothetical protein